MIVTLKTSSTPSLDQIRAFLDGSQPFELHLPDRAQAYAFIAETLRALRYRRLKRPDKGLVRRYLVKVTGFSRQQLTRLIAQYHAQGRLEDHRQQPPARPFAKPLHPGRYPRPGRTGCPPRHALRAGHQEALRARLHAVRGHPLRTPGHDLQRPSLPPAADGPLSAPAGDRQQNPAGDGPHRERRKPRPQGQPGYLRIDSVHQGDLDGIKGLYLINAIDEVTQFQFIAAVERISEHFLLPILERLILAFPFTIRGFHADNGSEYINHRVAQLLTKLHVAEFTKSRARRSNDNALVESKNGSIVRKHLGYSHIPGRYASQVNDFTLNVLSPYLNFHRPCFFPEEAVSPNGRITKRYRYEHLMTPYEKLKSLNNAETFLQPHITFQKLDEIALKQSDNDAARQLNQARTELFQSINSSQHHAA